MEQLAIDLHRLAGRGVGLGQFEFGGEFLFLGFQCGNLPGDCGLGDMQTLRSAREIDTPLPRTYSISFYAASIA